MYYADINHIKTTPDYEAATYDELVDRIIRHCSAGASYADPEFFWKVAAVYRDLNDERAVLDESIRKVTDDLVNEGIEAAKEAA